MKEQEPHKADELKDFSFLSRLKGEESPFLEPEDYFDQFSERLDSQLEKESHEILDQIPRQEIFQVPKGYFSQLPQQIVEKVSPSPPQVGRVRRIRPYWLAAAIAASFTLLLWFQPWSNGTTDSLANPFADFSEAEMIEALSNEGIESGQLLAMVELEALDLSPDFDELETEEIERMLEEIDPAELEAALSDDSLFFE